MSTVAKRVRDQQLGDGQMNLLAAVQQALAWFFWIPKDRLQVAVKGSTVTLSGEVDWLFQKCGAEKAVSRVEGVTEVINRIEVNTDPKPEYRHGEHPREPVRRDFYYS